MKVVVDSPGKKKIKQFRIAWSKNLPLLHIPTSTNSRETNIVMSESDIYICMYVVQYMPVHTYIFIMNGVTLHKPFYQRDFA